MFQQNNPDREVEKSLWYPLDWHIGEHPAPLAATPIGASTKDITQYNMQRKW